MASSQMTVLKDVRTLVGDAIAAAVVYLEGGTPEQTNTYNNNKIDVPAKPSAVVTVDKDNVQQAAMLTLATTRHLISPVCNSL